MSPLRQAQSACAEASALLITSGAGMGVDSGLPDFRGNDGFWKAYPPYQKLGLQFIEMANPAHFQDDPELGWGFYGHRRNLYRATSPHPGFARLLAFGESLPHGYFSFTSNVDGHFQRSGFDPDRVIECHGSIDHLQCVHDCQQQIWPAAAGEIEVDENTMRADAGSMPRCPDCGALARPNILMFGDWGWNGGRCAGQESRYDRWLRTLLDVGARLVILEFGAGRAVPTVRLQSEQVAAAIPGSTLIRVNPRDSEIEAPCNGISIASGALAFIEQLEIG